MKDQNIDNIQFRIKLGSHFRNKKKISIKEELKLFGLNLEQLQLKPLDILRLLVYLPVKILMQN